MGYSDIATCVNCGYTADQGHDIDCPKMAWETWCGADTVSESDHSRMYDRVFDDGDSIIAAYRFVVCESECGHIRTRAPSSADEQRAADNGVWTLAEMDTALREDGWKDDARASRVRQLRDAMLADIEARQSGET